jgi:Gon7 family
MPDPFKVALRATYTSPSESKVFSTSLSAAPPSSHSPTAVKDKVNYLSELRASTKQLQEDINIYLTQKMEEDKLSMAMAGQKDMAEGTGGEKEGQEKSKEELLEENYGEEEMGDEES